MINLNQTNINPSNDAIVPVLNDLQGDIIKSGGRDHTSHIFLRFTNPNPAKAWISQFSREVTSTAAQLSNTRQFKSAGKDPAAGQTWMVNFGLSAKGYTALGATAAQIPSNPSFRKGLKGASLGDPDVEEWEENFQGDIHAMISLSHDDRAQVDAKEAAILAQVNTFATAFVQRGDALKRGQLNIEHFGYADGLSQPLFIAPDITTAQSETLEPGVKPWDASAPLNLVLVPDSLGQDDNSFGSYMVYRKLEQDVDGFNASAAAIAGQLGLTDANAVDIVGAMAIGRTKNGDPLALLPNAAGSAPLPSTANNFTYAHDTTGAHCPFSAHVRKTNPRGDIARTFSGATDADERSRRIARRGIPYGDAGTKPVGLNFKCYQADVGHQFEFMQTIWANDSNFVKPGTGEDPIIGSKSTAPVPQTWANPHNPTTTVRVNFGDFVTMKGGEYFFMPSITTLKTMEAKLAPAPAAARAGAAPT